MNNTLIDSLNYLKFTMFHPFDGFYEIKHRNKGSLHLAIIIMALYGILQCIRYQYTGFIINPNPLSEMNSFAIFISSISGFLLFSVSNWTITTLFNGKGKLGEIFLVVSYSLVPLMLGQLILTVLSNFTILEEVVILYAFMIMGAVWFVFMALAGLTVIHEYSFTKNIQTLLATAASALIIVFICILFFTLIERMYFFIVSVVQEAIRKMR